MTTIVVILLLFGFMIYHNGTVKKSREKIKDMEKVGVGGELDFLPKMTSKKRKERKMKVKRLRIKAGEFRMEAAPSDGDESEA